MENRAYFLGLDIGTDSVGYAVTDKQYTLLKYHGEPAWGSTLFDSAKLNTDRRSFRTARRRIDRRQQRVALLRELFALEIAKVDPKFFMRIDASRLLRSDTDARYTLFDDAGFTDINYHQSYPTIHHLIDDLMNSDDAHDVRLVYLACAWLVAHRGHFLSEVNRENIAAFTDFDTVWNALLDAIQNAAEDVVFPWRDVPIDQIADVLKRKTGITQKYKQLCAVLFKNGRAPKQCDDFPYSCEALLKAICGGKISAAALFGQNAYADVPSFSLSDPDQNLAAVFEGVGDDAEILLRLKAIFDWSILADILSEAQTISAAKVKAYEQHRSDLALLKRIIKKYRPEQYRAVFRALDQNGYAQYSGHFQNAGAKDAKRIDKVAFSDQLKKTLKGIVPDAADQAEFEDMLFRIGTYTFLPKQRDGDNRVIPYQLYWHELHTLLQRAEGYLPFLKDCDADGLSVAEKILSIFTYRIPYYVGPLNCASQNAWLVRKPKGRILPWNFDDMVDCNASEEAFIWRMTNNCTYLAGEKVLPRESLIYHRFTVLNEINKLKIDGEPISVSLKQAIYVDVFEKRRKVTLKTIREYLTTNGHMSKANMLSGVDDEIHSNLKSHHDFKRLLEGGVLNEAQVEEIILRITLTEDRQRLKKHLQAKYAKLSEDDINYLARLNYRDFGRLSRKFLTELEGVDVSTGEVLTISKALWDTNDNLMELLSDRYTFAAQIRQTRQEYYREKPMNLDQQLTEMRLSNAVKRPVIRALEIIREVHKAFGCAPQKVFIEMTRGASEDQKNKRTKSRRQQLMELYAECDSEDARMLEQQLQDMGDRADTLLQSDRLYLYYMQLGRCMYSWQPIDIGALKGDRYNIEHIYPRAYVKDDSIINNEVLVQSELNSQKSNDYPISAQIRTRMRPFWEKLQKNKLLSDEKFKRLTRATPFSSDEKLGFINRQLTETSQSTKAVAEILHKLYPETEVVYVKARLASDFRQAFDLVKSRQFNDLHHAKDAYLNIVVGNVYDMKFSKRWFNVNSAYSLNMESMFTHPVVCGGETLWDGAAMLGKVKATVQKNNAHMTKYAYCRKGGLFDQMPVRAKAGLVPLKRGLPTEKYGGYNKVSVSFFLAVGYRCGRKKDVMIMPVELMYAAHVLDDERSALTYAADRIYRITGKEAQDLTLPLGLRPIKINTMLSLDGFRVTLSGTSGGAKTLIAAPFMPFAESQDTQRYIKRLEVLAEKVRRNPRHVYDARYDCVTPAENLRLYDLYIEKLDRTIYAKRINNPIQILLDGRDRFAALSVVEQAQALLNVHQVFGRISGGIDLSAIGGGSRAAATISFNINVSNWAKTYADVRIIDTSASGLWEKHSRNLLELL